MHELSLCDDLMSQVPALAEQHKAQAVASKAPVIRLCSRRDASLAAWIDWLYAELEQHRERLCKHQTLRPNIRRNGQLLHGEARCVCVRSRPGTYGYEYLVC